MTRVFSCLVGAGLAAGIGGPTVWADDTAYITDGGGDVETIRVVAARENRTSRGATGLDLSLTDTPQAVSVLDRSFMDTFALDDVNSVLRQTTGVNVESVETDRTYYNARGYDIKSMQVDGIGLPFNWNVAGALDTVLYERVEVVRGANGLLTGTGNPSGTINYVRKRPTNDFEASAELTIGSWDKRRVEADISTPLTDTGTWAARVIGAVDSSDSHLNLYHNNRKVISAIIDGELTDDLTVTFGYAQQDNKSKGVLWGALPMLYSDGTQTDFDVSATTSQSWTYWNTYNKTAFGELSYALGGDWEAKAVVTYNNYDEPSELFYVYSAGFDRDTGLGLYGYPGAYRQSNERWLVDVTLTGSVSLGGRSHELFLGTNLSWADNEYLQSAAPADSPAWGAMPSFPGWTGEEIPRPDFGPAEVAGSWTDEVKRLYGAGHFHLSDAFSVILGFNAIDVKSAGISFDASMDRDEQAFSPYVGALYKIGSHLTAYASYSDIFEPQSDLKEDLSYLGAAKGKSYEAGLKGEWFGGKLYTALSLFKADQDNYAQSAGYTDEGIAYSEGIDLRTKGFELEAAGYVTENWMLRLGYTGLQMDDPDGNPARTFIPRRTINAATDVKLPVLEGLSIGASLKWQDAIYLDSAGATINQGAYALIGLVANYAITDRVSVAVNVKNLTDKKYLTSLYWDQAFYGAPRSVLARLKLRY